MLILKNRAFVPTVFLLIGLFYFFEPFFSSWFEIIDPWIARNIFFLFDWSLFAISSVIVPSNVMIWVPEIIFGTITLCYILFCLLSLSREWTRPQKRYALLPLMLFPLILLLMSPLGLSFWGDKRVNSHLVGGWSRMILAGGPNKVRSEGLYVIENSSVEELTEKTIPASIKKLGYWVEIEQDNHLLLVGLGRAIGMSDEFGYIIAKEYTGVPIPRYLAKSEFYRIWRLADGIYFFEQ